MQILVFEKSHLTQLIFNLKSYLFALTIRVPIEIISLICSIFLGSEPNMIYYVFD
jgi:hypothetical protein